VEIADVMRNAERYFLHSFSFLKIKFQKSEVIYMQSVFIKTKRGERLVGVIVEPKENTIFSRITDGVWLLREKAGKISFVANSEIEFMRPASYLDKE
jgi:hypothetical protein